MPLSDLYSPNEERTARHGESLLSEIIDTQNDLAAIELDLPTMMHMVAHRIRRLTKADGVAVQLLDGDHLVCRAGSGIMEGHEGRRLSLTASLAGAAVSTGTYQHCDDTESDSRVDRTASRQIGFRSMIAVPLIDEARAIGVILVVRQRPHGFDRSIISALRLMTGVVAASLRHASEFEIKKRLLTEKSLALAQLRESEKRFCSAFKHAAIGMALVGLDGRWLQVNEALCRIVGYTEAELLVTNFQAITCPDDLHVDLAFVRRLIAGEIPDYQMVKRYIHRDRRLVWVLLSVSLVRSDLGEPLYFISQIQDITQRQNAEEALRASEEDFRATFEMAGLGKMQTDLATGRFLRVNRKFAEMTGYTVDELRSLTFADITHPDDIALSNDISVKLKEGEFTDQSIEKRYIRKDGAVIWVNLNTAVLRDRSGRPTRAICTVANITDNKRAQWLESDRRRVLEMVATDMPLNEVLDNLGAAIERQIESSLAAVMVLHHGEIKLHGGNLPGEWRAQLGGQCLSLAAMLSALHTDASACSITEISKEELWAPSRPLAAILGLKTCCTVVIKASDEQPLGLLLVFRRHLASPTVAEEQTLDMASKLATICIEHNHSNDQLSHLVRHDRLTGLPNRLMFEDRIQQALALSARTGKQVALMVLDVDKFKTINDTLGHYAGDHLLQQFAQRLRSHLRESDTMARVGGDEFVIILPELEDVTGASVVAGKLVAAMIEPFQLPDQTINATCSIGIAIFPQDADDAISLQKRADEALYRVKQRGRNGFSF